MKKNTKISLIITWLLVSSFGITTILVSESISGSSVNNIHDTSNIFFKELPHVSQKIAWNVNGSQICVKPLDQNDHEICSDGANGAIITWHDNINYLTTGLDIFAQHIDTNGAIKWDLNGTAICTSDDSQAYPHLCSDGAGGAIITWQDRRNGATYDIYAQHINSSGDVKWDPNGIVICDEKDDQYHPKICSDGAGGAIITWDDERTSSNVDIYAQRIDSNGAIKWDVNGTAICTESNNQGNPLICSDGAGGAIIAWVDARNGAYDIYAQRIDSSGDVRWEGNGKAVCTADDYQQNHQICSDNDGGAILAWEDERNGNIDIYSQRIDSNGIMLWVDNGTAISIADDWQYELQICSDNINGTIITWKDLRSGTQTDIYAQHINLNGTIQWTNNGKAICTVDNNQGSPHICSDGGGGVIIAWTDYRSGSKNDIYAQRIDLNGGSKWSVNGIPICIAEDTRFRPLITTDGAGTAVIVWLDRRNGDYDLYAQKLENPPPTSNHPSDIITSSKGSETINWTLIDDFAGGKYRVLANKSSGDYYVTVDWTSWVNNTSLYVPINRTKSGVFNYTIQYHDDQNQFGIPDTVIVRIRESDEGFKIYGYNLAIFLFATFLIVLIISKRFKKIVK